MLLRGVIVSVYGLVVLGVAVVGHRGCLCGVMGIPSFWCISC